MLLDHANIPPTKLHINNFNLFIFYAILYLTKSILKTHYKYNVRDICLTFRSKINTTNG